MSEIKVDTIGPRVDNGTLTIGASGDTVNIAGTAGTGFPAGVSLSGSTNNTVATVTGANALIGEANLTFDGSTLTVKPGSNVHQLKLEQNNATDYWSLHADSSGGPLSFQRFTGGAETEKMRIDTSGNVGIGETAPLGKLHVKQGDSGASALADAKGLVIESNADTGLSILQHTGGNGTIAFGDSDDNNIGMIQYYHGSANAMVFITNGAERMRILNSGNIGVGTTDATSQRYRQVSNGNITQCRLENNATSGVSATQWNLRCDQSSGGWDFIHTTRDGSAKFIVAHDGNVTNQNNSYGATSDERIKKDITDANSQWDDIKALKIKNYKLRIDDNSPTQLGVIAQDLETAGMSGLVNNLRPEASLVNINSDFGTIEDGTADNGAEEIKDEEGNITGYEDVFTEGQKVKSVKYSVLYMKAIKALQESMERIETLEAKVTALENA